MPFFVSKSVLSDYAEVVSKLTFKLSEMESAVAIRIAEAEARALELDRRRGETNAALMEQSAERRAVSATLHEVQQERDRLIAELQAQCARADIASSEAITALRAAEAATADARQERDRLITELQAERVRADMASSEANATLRAAETAAADARQERDRLIEELKNGQILTDAQTRDDAALNHSSVAAEIAQNEAAVAHAELAAVTTSRAYVWSRTSEATRDSGLRQRLARSLLTSADGERLGRKAVFTLHKTASMLVWKIYEYFAAILNVPVFSPNGKGGEYIYDEINIRDHIEEIRWPAGLYGPFRGSFEFKNDLFDNILITLRDPRDILTSMYYSWTYSHPIIDGRPTLVGPDGKLFNPSPQQREEWKNKGIDIFVIEYADFVENNIRIYLENKDIYGNANILYYEDMISDPHSWLTQFMMALGSSEEDGAMFASYMRKDLDDQFSSVEEDINNHRRQVNAGDYARKLQSETILEIDKKFSFYFDFKKTKL